MPLTFQNRSGATAYISLLTVDSGCSPDPWRKSGWYVVADGADFTPIGGDLRSVNRYMAWYADQWAGGPEWASGGYWYQVTNSAFGQCYDDSSGCNVWDSFNALDFAGRYGCYVLLGRPGSASISYFDPPPPPPSDDDDGGWFDDDDDDDDDDDGSEDDDFGGDDDAGEG